MFEQRHSCGLPPRRVASPAGNEATQSLRRERMGDARHPPHSRCAEDEILEQDVLVRGIAGN